MKCKFEHIFNTNSFSEFLPPFHETSRMFFDILENTPLCDTCHIIDDYEHYFISCKSLDSFWNDVKILLEKLRIGIHILSLKNLVFGYKL
jgi:hypothetical protein